MKENGFTDFMIIVKVLGRIVEVKLKALPRMAGIDSDNTGIGRCRGRQEYYSRI
ncbi:MAG: hypothetical protein WAM14_26330 [Candidatus Nitrosopolaris sp.]